ncbi:P-type conjugative transfer protein TrbJ [Xanthomonas nasturtii]|uniref:P-type conjugative transfer protein TrbJ n=1 Tax=Xanthomonas nasturtii TaxID=1843581 RepID=UPI002012DB47|nr:P-type conjugative transfer protein TrbJ [Xanthomonas nasturtii]MCL1574862.1 P-type conjugative transfer protein TrbJ [Xanthomonas nasturtii]MCL1586504.1 P-type conjugative transfer protein TrbJ [Xanthomonas nasturtii]
MKIHKTLAIAIAIAIAGASFSYTPPAAAQLVVVDPTNYIANYMTQLRAVISNSNEVRQIQQQLQALQNMQQNTESLRGLDLQNEGQALIGKLSDSLKQGQALSMSGKDFNQQFQTMFPGYKPDRDYSASYDKWNQTTRDSVMGAMTQAGMQLAGIRDEQTALAELRKAATGTTGQKQAIDAANQIALKQVESMQSLRGLMVAQMQAEGTHIAAQTQAAQAKEASIRDASQYRDPRAGFKPKPIRIGN